MEADFFDSVLQMDAGDKVDTPEVPEVPETPAETPSSEVPETPAEPETPKVEEPGEKPDLSIDTFLAEKSQGRIKSEDDLQKILSERDEFEQKVQSFKPHEYKSHLAEAIDKFVESGGKDVDGFLRAKDLEPEKLGDMEALLALKKIKEPELSEEEHKLLINHDYPAPKELSEEEKDLMTNEEIAAHESRNRIATAKQIHLKREAIKARNELSTYKQQLMAPEPAVNPEAEKAQQDWNKATEKAVSEFKGIQIPDETPFHMELSASQKADVLKVAKDPNSLWSSPAFKNKDGSVNMNHVLSVIQFAQNPQLMKVVQENYLAAAVDNLKAEIQNKKVPAKDGDIPLSNDEEPGWMQVLN